MWHESEWTPGAGDGQGGLVCCDSWGRKKSDMTERQAVLFMFQLTCVCAPGHNAKGINVGHHLNKTFKIPIYVKKEHISYSVSRE